MTQDHADPESDYEQDEKKPYNLNELIAQLLSALVGTVRFRHQDEGRKIREYSDDRNH
ncbi:MAG: hypothetical protein K2X81_21495 [Candidatus Obscuribacterales bacterium]|nr:hypothetical protein [Candidatus Obscuribacterales bacterium]